MIHVRINNEQKMFLFENDNCISDGYDEIQQVGIHFCLRNSIKDTFRGEAFLFNSNKKKIEKKIERIKYWNKNHIVISENDSYLVLSSINLESIFETKKKECSSNFYYLNKSYYTNSDKLFLGDMEIIGILNEKNWLLQSYHFWR